MEDENLIESVRKYCILYNCKRSDYRNVDKKEEAWKRIAEEFNCEGTITVFVHKVL